MKRWLKYFIVTISVIVCLIIAGISFDMINARIFRKSPIISWYEYIGDYGYVDRGVLFDVFYCNQSADIVFVSWKLKGSNYTCSKVEYEPMISVVDNVFVKTYTIENIEATDDKNYQYWTVSQYSGEMREIVKVPVLSLDVKAGKKYEIIFKIKSNKIKENIESIFKNADIEYIRETNKDINQFIW